MKVNMTEEGIRINKEKLLKALYNNLGIVTKACQECGVSRTAYYDYCHSDPEFKEAVRAVSETTLDFVESMLFQKIREGEMSAILFYMKYKGRQRGYSEKVEIDGTMKHSIDVIRLIGPPADDVDTNDLFDI